MKEQLSEENVRALVSYRLSRAKETRNREIIVMVDLFSGQ